MAHAQTLTIGDRVTFAKGSRGIVETLFNGPRTAAGTFRIRKNGILLCDLQDKPRAFVVANGTGFPFIVSCFVHLRPSGRRQVRYMHSLCDLDAEWLGIGDLSLSEQSRIAGELWAQLSADPL